MSTTEEEINIQNYVTAYTQAVADPKQDDDNLYDLVFFRVRVLTPDDGPVELSTQLMAATLRPLLGKYRGDWNDVNLLDGEEHSYLEIGGWIGSQELALRLMALGEFAGLWQLLSPLTMLSKDTPADLVRRMAESGFISVVAKPTSS